MPGAGIGAAGIVGVAFENLAAPVLAGTPTAGGALTAGTYRYYATAINANGETGVSNEVTVTTAAGNLTAHLTWAAITGATGYKIYRTASGGGTNTELLITTVGAVTSYDDTAVGAPAGAFPTANTATNPGVYVAPTKFVPVRSETIHMVEDTVWRRAIRNTADFTGATFGNEHPEGTLAMEASEDVVVYFMHASRATVVKSGASPNFQYVYTPVSAALPPNRTLSITIVRNGQVFGYTGCVVGSYKFGVDGGLSTYEATIISRNEAVQSVPTDTWGTTAPYGMGQYSVEFPTGSPVTDSDTFEMSVEDGAVPEFRLKSTGRGADYIRFGERTSKFTAGRDFLTRTDYDNFRAQVSQSVTLTMSKGVNNSISILMPVAIATEYPVNLSGQGDLIRASIPYNLATNASGWAFQVTLKTQENIS
jgi:hypothetical protein